jgi:hypothetical protein
MGKNTILAVQLMAKPTTILTHASTSDPFFVCNFFSSYKLFLNVLLKSIDSVSDKLGV